MTGCSSSRIIVATKKHRSTAGGGDLATAASPVVLKRTLHRGTKLRWTLVEIKRSKNMLIADRRITYPNRR
ncbi:unnamed protein product [Ixodes pacificus]